MTPTDRTKLADRINECSMLLWRVDAEDKYYPLSVDEVETVIAALRAPEADAGEAVADPLADLVTRFSEALLAKLRAAEKKYGYDNGWLKGDWQAHCQKALIDHLAKGDPRDVAAYCAFLWHHGWPTIGPITPREVELVAGLAPSSPAQADMRERLPAGWSLSQLKQGLPSDPNWICYLRRGDENLYVSSALDEAGILGHETADEAVAAAVAKARAFPASGEAACTCGGDPGQPAAHHDISCPKAIALAPVEGMPGGPSLPSREEIARIIEPHFDMEIKGTETTTWQAWKREQRNRVERKADAILALLSQRQSTGGEAAVG